MIRWGQTPKPERFAWAKAGELGKGRLFATPRENNITMPQFFGRLDSPSNLAESLHPLHVQFAEQASNYSLLPRRRDSKWSSECSSRKKLENSLVKVGLGISRTNADSQWNPVYNAFHRIFCCGNETTCR